MDAALARARLERMVAHDQAPTLSSAEIDDLLLMAQRPDADGYVPYSAWRASTVYTQWQYRIPTVNNGHYYTVTTAGTSAASEPVWPTASGATVVDGGVTWRESGSYLWTPTYNLKAAAAEGWRLKAGKVASHYAISADGASAQRQQMYEHCLRMAEQFSRGGLSSVLLTTRGSQYGRGS